MGQVQLYCSFQTKSGFAQINRLKKTQLQCSRSCTCEPPAVSVYFSLLDGFNQRDSSGTQLLPCTRLAVVPKQLSVGHLGGQAAAAFMTPSFPTSFGSPCPSPPWSGAMFTVSVQSQQSFFTNIQQCLAFEQQHYMFLSWHRLGFQGCKNKISCSDSGPHQGAFCVSMQKRQKNWEIHLQQLAAFQGPVVSPQVISKTAPCSRHDNGCVPLFLHADKNQNKSEHMGLVCNQCPEETISSPACQLFHGVKWVGEVA